MKNALNDHVIEFVFECVHLTHGSTLKETEAKTWVKLPHSTKINYDTESFSPASMNISSEEKKSSNILCERK